MRTGTLIVALVAFALSACGDNIYATPPYYGWTAPPIALGAYHIDALAPDDPDLLATIDRAADSGEVVLFYAHLSVVGVSLDTIDAVLGRAETRGLSVMSFADLASGPPHPGICLSFDDTEVDAWYALEPLLARHGAHVTFFVTKYTELTDDQRVKLHELYANGHSIEAHGVHHIRATDYIAEHGIQAYIDTEVLPSIQVLRDDGFAPVAYAHPNGSHTRELDDALLDHISFVRATSGPPR